MIYEHIFLLLRTNISYFWYTRYFLKMIDVGTWKFDIVVLDTIIFYRIRHKLQG